MSYSARVINIQIHGRELSKWSWRLLFMSPSLKGSSLTNLKTCSVLQIFIFLTKSQPRCWQRKAPRASETIIHRTIFTCQKSSSEQRTRASPDGRSRPPVRRLLLGAHLRRFPPRKDALGKDCVPVRCASRDEGENTQRTQQINRKVAWRTREKAGATEKPLLYCTSSCSAEQRRTVCLKGFSK